MRTRIEVEAKFRLDGAEAGRSLLERVELAGCAFGEARSQDVRDAYYDSRSRALLAAGWSFRWRGAEGRYIASLKSLVPSTAAVKRRTEMESEVEAGAVPPVLPPGPLASKIRELTGGEELLPLAAVVQHRLLRPLLRNGSVVAELSIDEVAYPGGEIAWEAEIERAEGGSEEEIGLLSRTLVDELGLEMESRSKFERALESVDRLRNSEAKDESAEGKNGGERESDAGDPIEVFAADAIRKNLKALKPELVEAGEGKDPESILDARIAVRRIRTCLAAFGGQLDAKLARKVDKGLGRLCRRLGELRDCDVLLADVRTYVLRLPGGASEGLAAFIGELEAKRESALAGIRKLAESQEMGRTYAHLRVLVRDLLRKAQGGPVRPAGLDAPVVLSAMLADLLAYEPFLRSPAIDESAYHRARRSAKRLRYALEFFEALLGPEAGRCIADIRSLQNVLGELNDTLGAVRAAAAHMKERIDTGLNGTAGGASVPHLVRYLENRRLLAKRIAKKVGATRDRVFSAAFRRRFFALLGSCPLLFRE